MSLVFFFLYFSVDIIHSFELIQQPFDLIRQSFDLIGKLFGLCREGLIFDELFVFVVFQFVSFL